MITTIYIKDDKPYNMITNKVILDDNKIGVLYVDKQSNIYTTEVSKFYSEFRKYDVQK